MKCSTTELAVSSPDEILSLFYLAAKFKRPVFVHMRAGNVIASLQEVIADAVAAGASLHVVHLNSAATHKTREALRMIEGARLRGLDVSTEAYPYIAGATLLESAFFDTGWQERQEITYSDLLWPATGERLNPALFERYRKQGGTVVIFSNTEEMIRAIVSHPLVMIASDGILEGGIAYVPSSSRLAHTAKPSRSQYGIFTRSRRRLEKQNRCPANASSFIAPLTSACRPSKLRRMSHGEVHKYTRTLAGR